MGAGVRCNECGKKLETPDPRARYCNRVCRQARYDRSRRGRDRHRKQGDRLPLFERPFLAFDGEGISVKGEADRLVLLASNGRNIHRKTGLSTEECFRFLISSPPLHANIWFGGGWDVNMMLRDLPMKGKRGSIEQLYKTTRTTWKGWKIHYVPRKFFDLSRHINGRKVSFRSYDVLGFFQTTFEQACREWGIRIPKIITEGKKARGNFASWPMAKIIAYNDAECSMLVKLMDRFREAMREAGWSCSSWHGPGALASVWLRRENIAPALAAPEGEVADAASRAYFGGRVENAIWGRREPVFHYDINSAYPASMRDCIDLGAIRWSRRGRDRWPDEDFSLVHVRWSVALSEGICWGPLPWRDRHGTILYPPQGEGWYYANEVQAAIARFPKGRFRILESYVPIGPITYPARAGIERDYDHRASLKAAGSPANVPVKLALNSLYGKLAMRALFNGERGRYYSLPWAGYITAGCRSEISRALLLADSQVALTMTDGLWSLVPLDLPIGPRLGEWSFEAEDVALSILQAGVYRVDHADGTSTNYTRGFERGTPIDFDAVIRYWRGGGDKPQMRFRLHRFVGMGLALNFPKEYGPHYRTFVDISKELSEIPLVGTTKRAPSWSDPSGIMLPLEAPPHTLSYPYEAVLDQAATAEIAEARQDRLAAYEAPDYQEGMEG